MPENARNCLVALQVPVREAVNVSEPPAVQPSLLVLVEPVIVTFSLPAVPVMPTPIAGTESAVTLTAGTTAGTTADDTAFTAVAGVKVPSVTALAVVGPAAVLHQVGVTVIVPLAAVVLYLTPVTSMVAEALFAKEPSTIVSTFPVNDAVAVTPVVLTVAAAHVTVPLPAVTVSFR